VRAGGCSDVAKGAVGAVARGVHPRGNDARCVIEISGGRCHRNFGGNTLRLSIQMTIMPRCK
jgi:hypothetical protein